MEQSTKAYEPGTVAEATVLGVKGVRVLRGTNIHGQDFWLTDRPLSGPGEHWLRCFASDDEVTDVRPLVVLDLGGAPDGAHNDYPNWLCESARIDEEHMGRGNFRPGFLRWLADQIETKPPRIPEPGLWGVVEAARREHDGSSALAVGKWIHVDALVCPWSHTSGNYTAEWSDLIDPVLIRGGLS